MATYDEIYGKRVEVLSSDPGTLAGGDIWYNSATGTLKGVVSFAAWSAANPMTATSNGGFTFGHTQSAVTAAGGYNPNLTTTSTYNGSSWTTAPATMNTGRGIGGAAGTSTAGFAVAGYQVTPSANVNATEEYNGSSWTTTGTLPWSARGPTAFGTQTAGVAAGGYSTTDLNSVAEYDGSSWTNATAMPMTHNYAGSFGQVQTAGSVVGGYTGPSNNTETSQYDGTNWTSGGALPEGKKSASAFGVQTAAVFTGGTTNPGPNATTSFSYDGSTWAASAAIAGSSIGHELAGGTSTAGLLAWSPGTSSQEFNVSINTITPGVWAAGGNLNTARSLNATATNAPQDAGLTFGGNWPSVTADTEEYNGTTWAEQTNLPQALTAAAGAGTQTAGLCTTGRTPGGRLNNTYEYDGSSWTAGGNYTATQAYTSGAGTQTAGLAVGGETPPGTDLTTSSEYDGSSWTAGNACNTPGYQGPVFGSAAGAIYACVSGPPTSLESESYNGTNWTAGPTTIFSNNQGGGAGTFPTGIIFGGPSAPPASSTQGWDGSTWSTRPSLGTARRAKGAGTSAGGLAMGGETPSSPTSNSTEEFTPESTAVTAKTLTTS